MNNRLCRCKPRLAGWRWKMIFCHGAQAMGQPERKAKINSPHDLPVKHQCQLLSISRSSAYYQSKAPCDEELGLMHHTLMRCTYVIHSMAPDDYVMHYWMRRFIYMHMNHWFKLEMAWRNTLNSIILKENTKHWKPGQIRCIIKTGYVTKGSLN